MKRVAVILFGQPRFFNITWPLIKQEFDFSSSDIEVDYYIHFWDSVGHTPASTEVSAEEHGGIIDVLDNEFSDHNVQMTDYTDLDATCLKVKGFYHEFIENVPLEDYQEGLRYRLGQHVSIKKAYNEILKHEEKKKFKYDLILKTRSDIVYRLPECYKDDDEYFRVKKKYYFNTPLEGTTWWRDLQDSSWWRDSGWREDTTQSEITTPRYIKCNALRFLNLEQKIQNIGGVLEKGIDTFYKGRFLEHNKKGQWQNYVERYFTRLAFNDWTLIASRSAADIFFGKYFENFYLTIANDIKNNPTPQRKKCIMSSEHCIQGQFLLNYDILASRPLGDARRDVRLLNKVEIKPDVDPAGKILCTEGVTTTEYLKYALIKRWSIDKGMGRIRAQELRIKHDF